MISGKKLRWFSFLTVLALLAVAILLFCWREASSCLGIRILSQMEQTFYTEYVYQDLSGSFLYCGEPAAVD